MAIQGLSNTTTFDSPDGRRPQNYRELLLMLYPNSGGMSKAPLTALTAVMKSQPTDDPVFHWFTKSMQDRRLLLNADLPTGGAHVAGHTEDITVIVAGGATAKSLKAGDLLYAEETDEVMMVATTPASDTTISVVRGFNGTAGDAVTLLDYDGDGVNPYLKVIGSAFEEGSSAPDPIGFSPIELFNQTQIFRSTYGLTNTAAATRTRTGNEEAELKREAMEIFGMDMEMAFFFGKKTTTSKNGNPLRTTKGILDTIPSDRKYAPEDGVLTYDWFETTMQEVFRYGSTEKLAFCGGAFLSAIARMVRKQGQAQYKIDESISEYGMKGITRLYTPTGTLTLKVHPLFSQMVGGTNGAADFTSMNNASVILDMENIRYRYLTGRDVSFQKDLQGIGVDSRMAGWLAECGLETHHPYTHSLITGVKKGAADTDI